MLHCVFGRSGSGKTRYIIGQINECSAKGMDCLYIVPEQQSMDAELMLESSGASSLSVSVLNFERLPDHVFRYIGGVARKSLDKAGAFVCLSNAVSALSDELIAYARPTEKNISALFSTISSLKRLNISPDGFDAACDKIKNTCGSALKIKLHELSLIYRKYTDILKSVGCDSADASALLNEALKTEPFFAGKAVFIDGMYTYTEQQYDIIARIAEQAEELYVSFTADDDDSGIFDGTNAAAERIKKLAGGRFKDPPLAKYARTSKEDLLYLEANIWKKSEAFEGNAESIRLCECNSAYDEALYAAEQVYALHKQGIRFSEIAIACRRPEDYDGIIDVVFSRYGIPYYFAQKENAATKPLSAFVTGILEMAEKNCSPHSVKKYIKSSFSVLSAAESDKLLAYTEAWRIRGKAWYADRDWLYNPEGYCEQFLPRHEEKLKAINSLRRRFASSVAPVLEVLRGKDLTVGEAVKTLYAHLKDCDVKRKLSEAAEAIRSVGDADGAAKLLQLWGVVTDIFDRLYTLSADRKITAGELREEIELMLSAYAIGAIPSYTDAVNIGSARLMRAGGCKAMLVLGVNDGVFPSMPEHSGIFSADESAFLENGGIELLPNPEKAMAEEYFFFYCCVSAPKEYLSLSYISNSSSKCSVAFDAVKKLFSNIAIRKFGTDERDYIFCKTAAFDRLPYIKNKALKHAVREMLQKDGVSLPEQAPLADERAYIGELNIKLLVLSATKIENYNSCHFKYLLSHILHLKEEKLYDFNPTNYGSFLHCIVEQFLKKRMESGSFVSASEDEIHAEVEAVASSYFKDMFRHGMSKRTQLLIERLKGSAETSCARLNEEFSEGGFVPIAFELEIDRGGVTPPSFVTENGKTVSTRGKIDRVDSYTVDGKTYTRIEDYKSSEKSLSITDIDEGKNIQMLSYLFTYCDFADTLPAGAIYYSLDNSASPHGLYVQCDALTPVMKKKHIGAAKAVDEETFLALKDKCYAHIKETGERILAGDMDIKPFKLKTRNCEYCPFGDICRMKIEAKF